MTEPVEGFDNHFQNFVASESLDFVKHNTTDFDQFKDFQSKLFERLDKSEDEKRKKEVVANLRKWEEMLPSRWSKAVLTKINPPADVAAHKVIDIVEKSEKPSLYLKGGSGSGKTYIAYATLRRYIGKGWVTPSQIKVLSEETLLGFAGSGFEGRDRFNKIFDRRFTIYLFDGIASRGSYTARESQLWEQLIEHIYSSSLSVILTSNADAKVFASSLSSSSESKLSHLINGNVVTVDGNGDTSKLNSSGSNNSNTKNNDDKLYDSGLFKE